MFLCVIASLARSYLVSILYLLLLYKVHKKLWQTRHWLLWEQNCVANTENLMGFAFTCEWLCNIYLLHFAFNFLSLLSSFYFICHNWPTWVCKEYLPFYFLFVEKENVLCCIMFSSEYDWAFLKLAPSFLYIKALNQLKSNCRICIS